MTSAAQRWSAELAAWAIPDAILAAAPESPWGFPVELWKATDDLADDSPSRRRAIEALPAGGSVLDVGCGGGRGSLSVAVGLAAAGLPAPLLTGVDESAAMLESFVAAAAEQGLAPATVCGSWPEVAGEVPPADVVVCHHVAYNVPELVPFARALQEHARRRVVLELTDVHPMVPLGPLWLRFHGLERPSGPDAGLAAEVLAEGGITTVLERHRMAPRAIGHEQLVAFTRRRLCLTADRDAEVEAAMGPRPADREVVTLWWDTASG